MPILKYKINGQWVELGGSGAGGAQVDPSLSVEGMAADAKVTGDTLAAIAEIAGNAVSNDALGEVVGALSDSIGEVQGQVDNKQSKVIFNASQPSNWQNGDIWLKPAE